VVSAVKQFFGFPSFLSANVPPARSASAAGLVNNVRPSAKHALVSARAARTLAILGCVLASISPIQTAQADIVTMHNGDRFTCEVVRQSGDELVIRTAYATGTITLDWAQVDSVELDEPAPVLLDDDRVVAVAALTRDEESLRLDRPAGREPMTVSPDQVTVVDPEPWETGRGGKFSGGVNLALEDESGNSPSTELDIDLTLRYRRRWSEFETFGQLEYDTTDGERSTDKWLLNNKYTRFLPHTSWYGAAWLRLKNDYFADVRLRTIAAPAAGYAFQAGSARLSIELGPTYVSEDYYNNPDETYWGPGLFLDYTQGFLGDRVEAYLNGMGFTSLSDQDKDLWVSWVGLRVPLLAGFVGSVEYEIDHDDPPAVNAKPTDETLRLKVGYQW
jgi:putative salt-induced outer membrane protein YdiY